MALSEAAAAWRSMWAGLANAMQAIAAGGGGGAKSRDPGAPPELITADLERWPAPDLLTSAEGTADTAGPPARGGGGAGSRRRQLHAAPR